MSLKLVDFSNYKLAISIQKTIFPNADGTLNILASLDRTLFMKLTKLDYLDDDIKYYLVYDGDKAIGITGLYCEKAICHDSAWLGWFGISPQSRGHGFGEAALKMTMELAKKQGYQAIRLYTDMAGNQEAINLYQKVGFVGEKYTAEKLLYDCYIFSKSLTNKPVELWQNKLLGLGYQTELDHMDELKIKEILNIYEGMNLN